MEENNTQPVTVTTKKRTVKQITIYAVINLLFIMLLMGFTLWWQNDTSLIAFADGIWFVFALQLTMAWSLLVYNQNLFTPLVHGVKTFFLLFVGKKPKQDYYAYYMKLKSNPIPSVYILISFIYTILILVVGIFLTIGAY